MQSCLDFCFLSFSRLRLAILADEPYEKGSFVMSTDFAGQGRCILSIEDWRCSSFPKVSSLPGHLHTNAWMFLNVCLYRSQTQTLPNSTRIFLNLDGRSLLWMISASLPTATESSSSPGIAPFNLEAPVLFSSPENLRCPTPPYPSQLSAVPRVR